MNHTNHWKGNDGDLFFDANFERWIFYRGSLTITITPWTYTEKGPMTELHLSSAGHEVIIEVVESRFNKELSAEEGPVFRSTILLSEKSFIRECCLDSLTREIVELSEHSAHGKQEKK